VTVNGRLAFVAGQVGMDAAGAVVGAGDAGAQTAQALANLGRVIESLGATWSDVVKFGWYVRDVSDLQVVRDARDAALRAGGAPEEATPASTLIQVAGLFRPEFLVEVDAVVALPD
jgi:enamine deaminase RidA (YjgF/YER057c/UK114 family)